MAHSHGEGSITLRKDGRWQASLQVDGKRRIVYGKTRQEAAGKLAALQQQARECGTLPAPAKHTLAELLDVWLEAKSPHWRPRTLADYRDICERYIRPALGRIHLSKLTPDRIARLLAAYRDQPRTALKVYRLLSQALGLAVRWGWLAHNPCQRVDAPNYRPKRKELWTPEHLRTFLCEAEGHWLWPLWVLAIATGCRLGELLALEWSDVDWCAGTLSISKSAQCIGGEWVTTSPKTQAGERIIALPAKALAALAAQHLQQSEWRAQRQSWPAEGLVFSTQAGERLSHGNAAWVLRRECRRLGLPPLTPHGLRHLHASLLLAEGLPLPAVSQRLGHAHSGVTLSVYAHAVRGQDASAAAAIGRALG